MNSQINLSDNKISARKGLMAISPLILFTLLYIASGIITHDFYAMPIIVAFLIASTYAICITRGITVEERVTLYSKGAAQPNIMLMIWIFILAGAFASSAKSMGAIEETVQLSLRLLPDHYLYGGIFLASCIISLSIGTSVGTIVALIPLAAGMAEETGSHPALMTAIVVGGAFFGDNLSFISDTTITATRTQGCRLKDKFYANIRIVLPAAVITLLLYVIMGQNVQSYQELQDIQWIKVIPYLTVLITALLGINVIIVLFAGIVLSGLIGISCDSYDVFGWIKAMGDGVIGMGELIIVTLMAGGLMELIRYNGGITYILHGFMKHIRTKRTAELSIAALVSIVNVCTANNTIAILTVGPLAKQIAAKYGVDPRKSASILDTFSCLIQGFLPYGAQLLIASGLSGINPLEIIPFLYYPFVMGGCALLSIIFRYPKKYS